MKPKVKKSKAADKLILIQGGKSVEVPFSPSDVEALAEGVLEQVEHNHEWACDTADLLIALLASHGHEVLTEHTVEVKLTLPAYSITDAESRVEEWMDNNKLPEGWDIREVYGESGGWL